MAANPKVYYLSPEAYLQQEREAEEKSEYINGQVYMMAGASREHTVIKGNIERELGNQLRTRACDVYSSDMRVHDPIHRSFLYPDVVVVCGEPHFLDDVVDNLLNPTIVFEVLSTSTEKHDRGKKAWIYRQIESLQAYIFVSQEEPHVEIYTRQPDGAWLLTEASDLSETISIPAIHCTLSISEVYLKVTFPR